MAVNNPHGHNQYTGHKKNNNPNVDSKRSTSGGSESAEAGRQGHKSDDKPTSGGKESSTGKQSHKNDA